MSRRRWRRPGTTCRECRYDAGKFDWERQFSEPRFRVIGLVAVGYGAYWAYWGLLALGFPRVREAEPIDYMAAAIFYWVIGLFLLRGAPLVVHFAYRLLSRDCDV